MTNRISIAFLAASAWALVGCGAAETASVAATQAELAAEQVEEGKKLQAKVQDEVAAAQQATADAIKAAEAAAE